MAKRTKNGKSVLGPLKPPPLKAALGPLAPALVALMNACVRIGVMSPEWAISALTPIRKPGANHLTCNGYRGITVGTLCNGQKVWVQLDASDRFFSVLMAASGCTLPAKLFASMLNDRIVAFTEAAGVRASGQAGFCQGYGCSDQQFALRALMERQRARGDRLYLCYVDFRRAFYWVPRQLLWEKLRPVGLDGTFTLTFIAQQAVTVQ